MRAKYKVGGRRLSINGKTNRFDVISNSITLGEGAVGSSWIHFGLGNNIQIYLNFKVKLL